MVTGDGPSLLGRNCLEHLHLVCEKIGKIAAGQTPESLETLITKHAAIFKDKLGTIQPSKAKLQVKQNATLPLRSHTLHL